VLSDRASEKSNACQAKRRGFARCALRTPKGRRCIYIGWVSSIHTLYNPIKCIGPWKTIGLGYVACHNVLGGVVVSMPVLPMALAVQTRLAVKNRMKFHTSVDFVFAECIYPRVFQNFVTPWVAATSTRPELVNQAYIGSMNT